MAVAGQRKTGVETLLLPGVIDLAWTELLACLELMQITRWECAVFSLAIHAFSVSIFLRDQPTNLHLFLLMLLEIDLPRAGFAVFDSERFASFVFLLFRQQLEVD